MIEKLDLENPCSLGWDTQKMALKINELVDAVNQILALQGMQPNKPIIVGFGHNSDDNSAKCPNTANDTEKGPDFADRLSDRYAQYFKDRYAQYFKEGLAVFEETQAKKTKGLTFEEAMTFLRQGKKIKRPHWSGYRSTICLDPGFNYDIWTNDIVYNDWEVVSE